MTAPCRAAAVVRRPLQECCFRFVQISYIQIRCHLQPGLVGLAVGIVDADCVKARGLRGFQGVETVLKDERFRRRGVQGLGGQQVNCRLMLADAASFTPRAVRAASSAAAPSLAGTS